MDICFKKGEHQTTHHDALLQYNPYEKCLFYMQDDMQEHEVNIDNIDFCR